MVVTYILYMRKIWFILKKNVVYCRWKNLVTLTNFLTVEVVDIKQAIIRFTSWHAARTKASEISILMTAGNLFSIVEKDEIFSSENVPHFFLK